MRKTKTTTRVARLAAIVLVSIGATTTFGELVSLETATQVAVNHLNGTGRVLLDTDSVRQMITESQRGTPIYYIIDLDPEGWAIVSADDVAYPVIAYSETGSYLAENPPPGFVAWMANVKADIANAIDQGMKPLPKAVEAWGRLDAPTGEFLAGLELRETGPRDDPWLLRTTWGQGDTRDWYPFGNDSYNQYCPWERGCGGVCRNYAPTGCVATAMAQIMKYHQWPPETNGDIPSYQVQTCDDGVCVPYECEQECSGYGWRDVDCSANCAYDWSDSAMPLHEPSGDIARLMEHIGVAVEMQYSAGASGAYMCTSNPVGARDAYEIYFRYASDAECRSRSHHQSTWPADVRAELDVGRPVLYGGCDPDPDSDAAHAFVCDGYEASDPDHFHFNWGWDGSHDNEYFYLGDLTPGSHDYTDGQIAIFNLRPCGLSELSVQSSPASGVSVALSPEDINHAGNGATTFNRVFYENQEIQLTAPAADASERAFVEWRINGVTYATTRSIILELPEDTVATAIYRPLDDVLLVNGSSTPDSISLNISRGTETEIDILLQNTGSVAIDVAVAKQGELAGWISLPTSTLTIDGGAAVVYRIGLDVPGSAAYRQYTGQLNFNSIALPLLVTVAETSAGENEYPLGASATINGEDDGNIWWNSWTGPYVLDDCNQMKWDWAVALNGDFGAEFDRLRSWKYHVTIRKIDAATYGQRLCMWVNGDRDECVTPGSVGSGYYWWEPDLYELARPGYNEIKIQTYSFVHCQGKDFWELSHVLDWWNGIMFFKAAWGGEKTFSSSEYQDIQDGFDRCRLLAVVGSVAREGRVRLYNNGEEVASRDIDASDVGDEVYWSLSRSELEQSNRFSLRGDMDDDTKATFSNLRLYVKYYGGSPAVEVTKALSESTVNLGDDVVVTIHIANSGSNIADDPDLSDAALPDGLSIVSGSLTHDFDDLDPGAQDSHSYTIRADSVGQFVLGPAQVEYESPGGDEFESTSNTVLLEVWGGLQVSTVWATGWSADGTSVFATASVTEASTGAPTGSAEVTCMVEKGVGGGWVADSSFVLSYDPQAAEYRGSSEPIANAGHYRAYVRAEQAYHEEAVSDYWYFEVTCDDGLFCNGAEAPDANGDCQPGSYPCPGQLCRESDDTCVGCLGSEDCDDGVFCNGIEICDADGVCQAGSDPCPDQICDEDNMTCVDCLLDEDCDDEAFCNGTETCVDQVCVDGPEPCIDLAHCDEENDVCLCVDDSECDDHVDCTYDFCDNGICVHVPDDSACSNGLFCDGVETCDPLHGCQEGASPCGEQEICDEDSDQCLPDCNENGVPDDEDISAGTSDDVNSNGIPDECETDCNENGVPDDWDIAQATSQDCDGDGTPDECEPDSDQDGVIDDCDGCPHDTHKVAPGVCGCGTPDSDLRTWYRDADGDTYGDPSNAADDCDQPWGYVSNDDDCDDGSAWSYPGAAEACDGKDNDCDGQVDEGGVCDQPDSDGDGDPDDTDCDDTDPSVHHGATEVCNGIDDDCDGQVDEDGVCDRPDSDGDGQVDEGCEDESGEDQPDDRSGQDQLGDRSGQDQLVGGICPIAAIVLLTLTVVGLIQTRCRRSPLARASLREARNPTG